ncbi:PAS domain-containing protein [Paracoccus sp. JM45]|uniref:PAS domain-containing protein n=1 Tax=Paracoccus sp. JM45 TaxID=2283626 RepID=UPI00160153AA|nr:PAS domain-containing protein [Paracoccus sp. JM45]
MAATQIPDILRTQFARSQIALSLATAADDMPLCLVNDAFTRLTGYDRHQAEGRNCRFMQDADTPLDQIAAMSEFLHDKDRNDGRFPVLNRTRDGRAFLNLVFLSKLRDLAGDLQFVLASQFEMRTGSQSGNDRQLTRSVNDVRLAADQLGLIMSDSTELIARSISTLAKITVRDE